MFKKIVDKIIQSEVARRKGEIETQLATERDKLQAAYAIELDNLNLLTTRLKEQINETVRVRERSEEEQKRLWERLDILRDNLNTEDVWIKLWEGAYSKAVDCVWEIFKKETLHLIELAKADTAEKVTEELTGRFNEKISSVTAKTTDSVNVPLLFELKEDAQKQYLAAQRTGDKPREQYNFGRLKLAEEVINEK